MTSQSTLTHTSYIFLSFIHSRGSVIQFHMFLMRPRWPHSNMTFNMCLAKPLAIVRAFPFFDLSLFHFIWFVNSTRVLKEMFDCHSFVVLGCEVWNCWTQVPSHNHYVCLLMQTMRAAVSKLFIIFLVFHKQNIILLMVLLTVKTQEVLISRVVAMWPVLTPKAKGYRNKDKDLCGRNYSFTKLCHSWHHIPNLHWRCHQFLVFIQGDM